MMSNSAVFDEFLGPRTKIALNDKELSVAFDIGKGDPTLIHAWS